MGILFNYLCSAESNPKSILRASLMITAAVWLQPILRLNINAALNVWPIKGGCVVANNTGIHQALFLQPLCSLHAWEVAYILWERGAFDTDSAFTSTKTNRHYSPMPYGQVYITPFLPSHSRKNIFK